MTGTRVQPYGTSSYGGLGFTYTYNPADEMRIQKKNTTATVYFTYAANGNISPEHDVNASAGRTYGDFEPRNLFT